MSGLTFTNLPLGDPEDVVRSDPELLMAWEAADLWSRSIVNSGTTRALSSFGASLMLACKYILGRVDQARKEKELSASEVQRVVRRLRGISLELGGFTTMKEQLGGGSSFQAATTIGRELFATVMNSRDSWQNTGIPTTQLQAVIRIWSILDLYTRGQTEAKVVSRQEVKNKLRSLNRGLNLPAEKLFGKGSEQDVEMKEDEEQQTEGSKEEQAAPEQSQDAPPQQTAPAQRFATSQQMVVPQTPEASAIMNRYDPAVGIVPIEGRVKSPMVLTDKDLGTLTSRQWVNDNIVDAYIALVCHTVNGHFQGGSLPATPRWHAWNTFTADVVTSKDTDRDLVRRQWPPALYPEAALEDVECHIFPICQRSHWFMGIAARRGHTWQVTYYSTLAGYEKDFERVWTGLVDYLMTRSENRLNLRQTQIRVPQHQPMQNNGNDCGVLVMAQVRWLAERWDTHDLVPNRIDQIRLRMIYELERWNIHV